MNRINTRGRWKENADRGEAALGDKRKKEIALFAEDKMMLAVQRFVQTMFGCHNNATFAPIKQDIHLKS